MPDTIRRSGGTARPWLGGFLDSYWRRLGGAGARRR